MPKYLPCRTCSTPALATRSGVLHSAGHLSSPSISYVCKRCGHRTVLSVSEFARLPEMTDAEIAAASCDLPFTSPDQVESARQTKS